MIRPIGGLLRGKSQLLAPGCPHRRSHLGHYDLIRIRQWPPRPFPYRPWPVRAPTGQWVMHWPQSEQSASSMVFRAGNIDGHPGTGALHGPDPQSLGTFSQIWTQRMHLMHFSDFRNNGKFLFQRLVLQRMVEGNFQNIQIIGDLLKAAIPAPLTGGTETVVLGQEKLHDLSPVAAAALGLLV